MEPGRPSQTAHGTAVLRARHYHFAKAPKILEDNLASVLAGLTDPDQAQAHRSQLLDSFAAISDQQTAQEFVNRIEEAVCIRARLTEETLLSGDFEQLVVLGAGLDSTAYRFGPEMSQVSMFEVDFPATQAWKREQLSNGGVDVPANLVFVPCDFESTTLEDALAKSGVDQNKKTLFSWLGVQMYLNEEAIMSTLLVLGQFAKGSTLVTDFIMPDEEIDGEDDQSSVKNLQRIVDDMGEPLKSRYTQAQLESRLLKSGFANVTFHSIDDLVGRFLGGDSSGISTPGDAVYLLSATV